MITIKNIQGNTIISVPITGNAVYHHSLMNDEYVRLSFGHNSLLTLPEGTYIEYGGEKYSLLEPYSPTRANEVEYKYEPEFRSEIARWKKLPVFYMDDKLANIETDWSITDRIGNIAAVIARSIKKFAGIDVTKNILVDPSLTGSKHLSFQGESIFDGLNKLAEEWATEWWVEKKNGAYYLHLSRCQHGTSVALEVGNSVNLPSVRQPGDGYANRFYVYGSTRNITQEYESGTGLTNHIVQKRLTLPAGAYPGGYIDARPGLKPEEVRATTLVFDHIYPASDLTLSEVYPVMKTEYDGESKPVRTYHVYYIKLQQADGTEFVYDPDSEIQGKKTSINFQTGSLAGYEFELDYHKSIKISPVGGGAITISNAFEILLDESTKMIIPNPSMVPGVGNEVVLFNVEMPESYLTSARQRLAQAAREEIDKRLADRNEYSFDSNPVYFFNNNIDLSVGQAVSYTDGGKTLSTRVLSVEKYLDCPSRQKISIGDEKISGTTQKLKQEVSHVNNNLNIIQSVNDLSKEIQNSYGRTQKLITENLAKSAKLWMPYPSITDVEFITTDHLVTIKKDILLGSKSLKRFFDHITYDVDPTTGEDRGIGIDINLFSASDVIAFGADSGGSGSGSGGSSYLHDLLDVNADIQDATVGDLLAARKDGNGNIQWTNIPQSSIAPDLTGYATQSWVTGRGYITASALTWAGITGKPTTLAGYGITDAPTKAGAGASGTWAIGISGNAASATKLQTARTIWGQAFDGTGNVSGAITGATTGSFSGNVSANAFIAGSSTYGRSYIELYGGTPFIDFHFNNSTADYTSRIIEASLGRLTVTGNLSVGTTAGSTTLYVSGTIGASGNIITTSHIQIGQAVIKYDATHNALYVEKADGSIANFYSMGEITAGGAGSGGSSSGGGIVTAVYKYDDLGKTFSGLANDTFNADAINRMHLRLKNVEAGQVNLTWANITSKPTTLAGYGITDAASLNHTHNYLPLTGGTLTGNILISTDSEISWARNTDNATIGFKNTGDADTDSYMYFKTGDNGNEYFKWLHQSSASTKDWMTLKSDGLRVKGILVSLSNHTHNYAGSSTAGGSATSALQLATARTINGTSFNGTGNITTANWGTARTFALSGAVTGSVSVNGGSNITLATALSTESVKDTLKNTYKSLDLRSLNADTWYPCTIPVSTSKRIKIIFKNALAGNKPAWATHASGFSMYLEWDVNGSGWGATVVDRAIYGYSYSFAPVSPCGGITQSTATSMEIIWLRGGGLYYYWTDNNSNFTIHTSGYSWASGTYTYSAPTRTSSQITDPRNERSGNISAGTFVGALSGNAASTTKLQTAKSIFGRSFDGTDNVTGQALVHGYAVSAGTGYVNGAIQVREAGLVAGAQSSDQYAPRIGFHWANRFGFSIIANAAGFKFLNQAETGYVSIYTGGINAAGAATLSSTLAVGSNVTTGGNYTSSLNKSVTDTWNAVLSGSVFQNPLQTVSANTSQPMLSWSNQIASQGYITRFTIGSRRPASSFGEMNFWIGNNDAGTSGVRLGLSANGSGIWTGTGVFTFTGGISSTIVNVNNRLYVDNTGRISPASTSTRRAGLYGNYDPAKIAHIWSIGTAYMIPDNGANFGNLYGLAYKYITNTTGGNMAGGHQVCFVSNGTAGASIGLAGGIWTSGLINGARICAGWDSGQTGAVSCSNWFRSSGSTGWYNEKWGGGIYMTDATYVRVSHNKAFLIDGVTGATGIGGHNTSLRLYGASHCGISMANSAYTWGMYSNSNGNMYIGRRTGSGIANSGDKYVLTIGYDALTVSGNIVATGEITAYSSSDIRLKENIRKLEALSFLRKVNTYSFDWKEDALSLKVSKHKHDHGFIAQEINQIAPHFVTHNLWGKGYLGIDQTKFIPYLVAGVNELDDEVTSLRKRVEKLEKGK